MARRMQRRSGFLPTFPRLVSGAIILGVGLALYNRVGLLRQLVYGRSA